MTIWQSVENVYSDETRLFEPRAVLKIGRY